MGVALRFFGTPSRCLVLFVLASLPGAAFALSEFRRANSNPMTGWTFRMCAVHVGFPFRRWPRPAQRTLPTRMTTARSTSRTASYTLGYLFLWSQGTARVPGIGRFGPDPTPEGKLVCAPNSAGDSPANGALIDLVPGRRFDQGTAPGLVDVRVNGAPVAVAADHTRGHGDRPLRSELRQLRPRRCRATHTVPARSSAPSWLAEGARFDALRFRVSRGFQQAHLTDPSLAQATSRRVSTVPSAANPLFDGDCGGLGAASRRSVT
jgi:hypothetical protein